jgi:hypothetical protein
MFHEVPMYDEDRQWAFHSNLGSITVVDRMTGFGYRDEETGFRDNENYFWLASGHINVLYSNCKTVGEAIEWIKARANNCIAYKYEKA